MNRYSHAGEHIRHDEGRYYSAENGNGSGMDGMIAEGWGYGDGAWGSHGDTSGNGRGAGDSVLPRTLIPLATSDIDDWVVWSTEQELG